ncbi:odorant receptor 22c-like [Contarinia nasturtii]|uniref:odorant receptor 22c-like n=1 Tax=Contarinia nasturtii TaxID=265458 RepID=UPI0012D40FF6|nr:odorant receptor 22c-like [Contarinia nasturtii]
MEEVAIYRKVIIYTTFATVSLASAGLSTCSLYVFEPIVTNLFYFITNQPLVREQPFQAVYPFIDQYSDKYFLACYIHLTYGGYCTATVFNGIDSVFITACFHIAAQFKLITMKIRNSLGNTQQNHPFSAAKNREVRHKLIAAINEQIKLFDVIDLFIKAFTLIIMMHFISVALIIGIGSINLLKSLDICKMVCDSDWYYLDVNNQKMIHMLILRGQMAKFVKVPFFEVTLTAYTKIMSTAGSYITLLNNMLKN